MKRTYFNLLLLFVAVLTGIAQQAAPGPAQQAAHVSNAQHHSVSADKIWADLMEGNKRFVAGRRETSDLIKLRSGLAKGQQPKVAVLACSDSRVAPELVFDKSLGDLFVVRSAGNIADPIGVGSLEYAVEHLGTSVLVVMGHTECGAVTAACSGDKMPTPGLQAIVDKIAPAVLQSRKANSRGNALIESAIKENIRQSAKDILASSKVLRHFVEAGKLTVFEAEYNLDTGEVIRLDIDSP
jgi:carbonic anhydrase